MVMPHLIDAVRELPEENELWNDTKLRSSKYLNNIIEQDHSAIEARIGPCLASRSSDEPKPPLPASNFSTASAKTNSISVN
jgi:transposase-like protein